MSTRFEPEVGNWYKDEEGMSFEVVAADEAGGTVEIQYFDGAVEELDAEAWYAMELVPREPPEDWSGPFDDLVRDDLGDTDEVIHPQSWSGPLDALEPEE